MDFYTYLNRLCVATGLSRTITPKGQDILTAYHKGHSFFINVRLMRRCSPPKILASIQLFSWPKNLPLPNLKALEYEYAKSWFINPSRDPNNQNRVIYTLRAIIPQELEETADDIQQLLKVAISILDAVRKTRS